MFHISVHHVHFNSLTAKHASKGTARSQRQGRGLTSNDSPVHRQDTQTQRASSPLLPTYFAASLPHFPAKVTLPAVTEDVHDLSSTVLCPLLKHPPSCQGEPRKKAGYPLPRALASSHQNETKPFTKGRQ